MTPRVAVVGGGIAGLAAAWYLRAADPPPAVTLVEASPRLGGKLCTRQIAGVQVELGADSYLTRPEHAERLCHRLGLGDDLVRPATSHAQVWVGGRLRPLPEGILSGLPTRLAPLLRSGLLSAGGVARAAFDLVLPRTTDLEQAAVGTFVRRRLGREVVNRLVDPLLGGVYAGDVDRLGVTAATPQLAAAARRHRSLLLGLRALGRMDDNDDRPNFLTVRGGLSRLVDRLQVDPQGGGQAVPRGRGRVDGPVAHRGMEVLSPVAARRLLPLAEGYRIELVASGGRGQAEVEALEVDGVVVAVPAFAAATLLREAAPVAASALDTIRYASVAVVTLIYPPGTPTPAGSGVLVPSGEGRLVKAVTWVSSKWPHVALDGSVVVRASVGRDGADKLLDRDDDELVAGVRVDLADLAGIRTAPTEAFVTRWERALPQYEVGHPHRVRLVEQALARLPGVVVTGSAYRGVGIAACVRDAEQTAGRLLALFNATPEPAEPGDTREPVPDGSSRPSGVPSPRTLRRRAPQR
ncbi:MAG: protoporphyrinogen oxidase [Nitriliruptorales bacterium]